MVALYRVCLVTEYTLDRITAYIHRVPPPKKTPLLLPLNSRCAHYYCLMPTHIKSLHAYMALVIKSPVFLSPVHIMNFHAYIVQLQSWRNKPGLALEVPCRYLLYRNGHRLSISHSIPRAVDRFFNFCWSFISHSIDCLWQLHPPSLPSKGLRVIYLWFTASLPAIANPLSFGSWPRSQAFRPFLELPLKVWVVK